MTAWLVLQLVIAPALLPAVARAQSSADVLTPIAAIQGAGVTSPLNEQAVVTWGVVTGVTRDGFYLQDPAGDGDPATSDGVYAFTYDAPTVAVGECVEVKAEVAEYYAKTELDWVTTITPSSACATRTITPVDLPLVPPGADPVAALEAFEGMVVRLPELRGVAHSPTKHFDDGEDEIALLPARWQRYVGDAHLFHDQAEVSALLFLSNLLGAALPSVQWGDLLQSGSSGLAGVLDYNFGKYQLLLLPDQSLTVMASEQVEAALPPLRGDEYSVCSFNLHGMGRGTEQFPDDADYAAALRQRAQLIAAWLGDCTVIALQETGQPADAEALAHLLTAEFGLPFTALAVAGPNSAAEDFPLTNSLLVNATRVTVGMVEAVAGCAAQDFGVVAAGTCAAGLYPVFDRPPLLAQLTIDAAPGDAGANWSGAQTVWVIDNHWKSKSGDEEANAVLRAAQAAAVAARVQEILADDANAQIVVLGDLNDYYMGAAVNALQSATGLLHAYTWLPRLTRYSYIFNGAAQVLDHALVTPNLAPQLSLVRILHIQADLSGGVGPLAYSDHDPVVLRLRPAGATTIAGNLGWDGITVRATDAATDSAAGSTMASSDVPLLQSTTDTQGEFRLWGLPPGTVTLQIDAPAWIVLEDALSAGVTVTATVGVVTPALTLPRHTTAMRGAWVALYTPWLAQRKIP